VTGCFDGLAEGDLEGLRVGAGVSGEELGISVVGKSVGTSVWTTTGCVTEYG
jgi:hypothetical protein